MKMQSLFLRAAALPLFFSCVLLSSCSDDDPKDTQAPDLAITNLSADAKVWNTVSLELDATDNGGIAKIELFVDGNLVTTDQDEPFSLSWDSNTVDDGSHTVRVIATDKSGNTAGKEVAVQVQNTLLSFTIGANHLDTEAGSAERGFVFLSDDNGVVIVSKEYHNGDHVVLKSPTFNGETFYLTEVIYEEYNGGSDHYTGAQTYVAVERGKNWVVGSYNDDDDDETYVGQANITFTNGLANYEYGGVTNGEFVWYNASSPTGFPHLTKSPSQLFMTRNQIDDGDESTPQPAPTYNLYTGIVVGNNTVDLSKVTKTMTQTMADFPDDALYSSVDISAYPVANTYTERYDIGYFSSSTGHFPVYYPGNAFPSYYTDISYETDKVYYDRGTTSTTFSLPQITNDVAFTFANNKLSYKATGAFDVLTTAFTAEDEDADWAFVLPSSASAKVIPTLQLPQEVQGLNMPSFGQPTYFEVYDWEQLSSYTDLKEFVRASAHGADDLYAPGKSYTQIEYFSASTNGRYSKPVHHAGRVAGKASHSTLVFGRASKY